MSEEQQADGTQLPTALLEGPRAKALADLGAVVQDLKFVMRCCAKLIRAMDEDPQDDVLMQALFTAAVITYARCFNTGKRGGLNDSDLTKLGFEGDPRGFHRQVMDMRSKHVAHSVNPFEMISVGAVLSPPDARPRRVEAIVTFSARHIAFDAEGTRQIFEVCKRLIDGVIAQRAERLQDDVLAEARTVPIDQLSQRSTLRAQPPGPEAAGARRS
jgi:hypothetical protein